MSTYSDTVIADTPVGYWRLGEASGTTADNAQGTSARDGLYVGTPTLGAAGALNSDSDKAIGPLDGTSQYVRIDHSTAFNLGNTWSIEAWVSRGSTGAYRIIASKGTGAYELSLDTDGTLTLRQANTGIMLATVAAIGTGWHHVVGTKNGSTLALYVDGSAASTDSSANATTTDNGTYLIIGGNWDSGNFFNGSLDEVAVYGTALSSTRVAAHYTAGTSAPTASRFDPMGMMGFFG
jgi:hypothetical protein